MSEERTNPWTRFWFQPSAASELNWVRVGLCLLTAVYFVSAWGDVSLWYAAGAPASTSHLGQFFRAAELTPQARWMLSPLYLFDAWTAGSAWSESASVYQAYLAIGIALALFAAGANVIARWFGRGLLGSLIGGSLPTLLVWVWFVGWANRATLLAGICEPVLSVSLAALAIAPSVTEIPSWRVTLARRLLDVQTTLLGVVTTALMLNANVWWNGNGAYVLAAAEEDRFLSLGELVADRPMLFEGLTVVLVIGLPLALWLLRRETPWRSLGFALCWFWCAAVGVLSAELLYAAVVAVLVLSINPKSSHTSG